MKLKKYLFLSTILIICACSTNLISSSNSTSKISDNISSEEIVSSSNNSIINSVSTSSSSSIKNSTSTSSSSSSMITSKTDEDKYNPDGSKLLPLPTSSLDEVWNENETLYDFQSSFPNGFNYIHGHQIVKTPKFYDNDEKGWKITFPNTGARLGLQTPFFVSNDKVDENHPWITVYGFNNERKIVQTKYVECPNNFYSLKNNSSPFHFYMSGEGVTYLEIRFTAPPYKSSQCYNFGIKQIGFKAFPYKYEE